MKQYKCRSHHKAFSVILIIFLIFLILFFLQTSLVHITFPMPSPVTPINIAPLLSKAVLEKEDYSLIFEQTGLTQTSVDELLLTSDGKDTLLSCQRDYLKPFEVKCRPLFWWLVETDWLEDSNGNTLLAPAPVCARPGDILISFSTHSFGWRHGHAGLILENNQTLECTVIGETSCVSTIDHWRAYSGYAILRPKNLSKEERKEAVAYALENLNDIPYRLSSTLFYPSCQDFCKFGFGVNCSSLIWYTYLSVGLDLDENHNRIVTPGELYHSSQLELIQVYNIPYCE